jgi:hypothetical protein
LVALFQKRADSKGGAFGGTPKSQTIANLEGKGSNNVTCFEKLTLLLQIVSIFTSFVATICAIIAIIYTAKNLKEIRNQFFEENRGQLVFYITKTNDDLFDWTVIKNFGNSPAKLISLKLSPELDWSKAGTNELKSAILTNAKNIFLAPGQHIKSAFDFRKYPEHCFKVELTYETNGKTFEDSYVVDLNYTEYVVTLEPTIKDEATGLKYIYKGLKTLNDRFL